MRTRSSANQLQSYQPPSAPPLLIASLEQLRADAKHLWCGCVAGCEGSPLPLSKSDKDCTTASQLPVQTSKPNLTRDGAQVANKACCLELVNMYSHLAISPSKKGRVPLRPLSSTYLFPLLFLLLPLCSSPLPPSLMLRLITLTELKVFAGTVSIVVPMRSTWCA